MILVQVWGLDVWTGVSGAGSCWWEGWGRCGHTAVSPARRRPSSHRGPCPGQSPCLQGGPRSQVGEGRASRVWGDTARSPPRRPGWAHACAVCPEVRSCALRVSLACAASPAPVRDLCLQMAGDAAVKVRAEVLGEHSPCFFRAVIGWGRWGLEGAPYRVSLFPGRGAALRAQAGKLSAATFDGTR